MGLYLDAVRYPTTPLLVVRHFIIAPGGSCERYRATARSNFSHKYSRSTRLCCLAGFNRRREPSISDVYDLLDNGVYNY